MKGSEKNFHHFVQQLITSGGMKRVSSFAVISGLSRRMIYYYLDELNYYLKNHNTPAYIQGNELTKAQQKQCEVLLEKAGQKEVGKVFTVEEREMLMMYHLLFETEKITIRFFEALFLISKNTVLKDITSLRQHLKMFDVSLLVTKVDGYYLDVDEFRRQQFIYIFFHLLSKPQLRICQQHIDQELQLRQPLWNDVVFEQIVLCIHDTNPILLKKISEEDALILAKTLLASNIRKERFVTLEIPPLYDLLIINRIEYTASKHVAQKVSVLLGRELLDTEIRLLAMYLLCVEKDIDDHYLAPHFEDLYKISQKIIDLFQCKYGIYFERLDDVLKNVQTYMKVAYYRNAFHLNIPNKSYRVVLERYPKVFQVITRIIKELYTLMPTFNCYFKHGFTDDMMSDLTLVFEDAILREQTRSYTLQALIVSDSSKVERSLIESHITQHLQTIQVIDSLSPKKVTLIKQDVELCITTLPDYVHHEGKTLHIHSVPTEEDIEKIQQLQYDFFYSRKRKIKIKYLLEELIQTHDVEKALNEIEHVYVGLSKTRVYRTMSRLQDYQQNPKYVNHWLDAISLEKIVKKSMQQFSKRNTATQDYEGSLLSLVDSKQLYVKSNVLILCGDYRMGGLYVDLQIHHMAIPLTVLGIEIHSVYVFVTTENMMQVPLIFEIEDAYLQKEED